jgi:hypothetical protein
MGETPVGLDHEFEILIDFLDDIVKNSRMRNAIIGGIDFRGLEMVFIEIETFSLGSSRRIKRPFPIIERVSGGGYDQFVIQKKLRNFLINKSSYERKI